MGADGFLNIVPCEGVEEEDPDLYELMVKEWPESEKVILGKKCWYWYTDTNDNEYPPNVTWEHRDLISRLYCLRCHESILCWT